MRVRCFVALVTLVVGFGVAQAGPKQDIQAKVKEAYTNYDSMDYDAARKSLNQALAIAKKAKLDKDPVTAKAYLAQGIVAAVNGDQDAAKLAFLSAVQIDSKIQLDPAYKSPELQTLLDQARTEASGGDTGVTAGEEPVPSDAGGADCASVQGLQHTIIDSGKAGVALPIEALVGSDVTAAKVVVMYRTAGATEFTEVKLEKDGECKYTGSIPASAMKGSLVHYYVAAVNDVGKAVASKGSSGSPNIIELTASAGGSSGDNEDPIGSVSSGDGGSQVDTGGAVPPKKAKLLLAVSGGTGFGYVSGETEGMNAVKNCCLGSSLVVIVPELGFYVNPHLSIGAAARIGIPVGANVDGHATAAPGGLVRVRYSTGAYEGLRFMGQLGIGVMRNTIKLDNNEPGMDTDVVAQGPLLIGGGLGYAKRLSSSVAFIADLSVLAGVKMGSVLSGLSPKYNNGFGADVSIGLQVGL
jgi:hypothetical protein